MMNKNRKETWKKGRVVYHSMKFSTVYLTHIKKNHVLHNAGMAHVSVQPSVAASPYNL